MSEPTTETKRAKKPKPAKKTKPKTPKKKKFAEDIELDSWSSNPYFDSEADFRRNLITDYDDMNKVDKDKPEEDKYHFVLLNQDEVVIPTEKAYIKVEVESVYAMVPIWASFPTDAIYDEASGNMIHLRSPDDGITRGYLQWQLSNALSGLPLFDHVFPEGLYLHDMIDDMPVYGLHMGS